MIYKNPKTNPVKTRLFRVDADRPLAMLKQCPVYTPTALAPHPKLAESLGIGSLHIKDESTRMRLGSFKALGGAFAVAQMISDKAGTTDFDSQKMKNTADKMTFATASAGNHGLSVAAGARVFGAHAVIFLSSSVPEGFAQRIRDLGAEVVRVDGSYEDSVEAAISTADARDLYLLADGSWAGYVDRPALVMEGYTVLAEECRAEFQKSNEWPTHVLLQAGVGGLAAAVAGHIRAHWEVQPEIIVVEPDAAPCLQQSVMADELTRGDGPESNMGRLDCKDASLIAFDALKNDADIFITITDDEAAWAVEILDSNDIKTTPSGAASIAGLPQLKLDGGSRCLVIVSEGLEEG